MIIGLDLSLTNSGWCTLSPGLQGSRGGVISPADKLRGVLRLDWLKTEFEQVVLETEPTFAFVEGYAYGIRGGKICDIAEWGGIARWTLMKHGVQIYVVSPQSLKKFVVGRGDKTTKKEDMKLWAYKRWNMEFKTNDECDAYCLAAAGLAFLYRSAYEKRYDKLSISQTESLAAIKPYHLAAVSVCRSRTRGLQIPANSR